MTKKLPAVTDDGADPDIELITDYLMCALTPEELVAVSDRLSKDEAFRRKVMPIIKLWNSPIRVSEQFNDEIKPRGPWGRRWARIEDALWQERPIQWRDLLRGTFNTVVRGRTPDGRKPTVKQRLAWKLPMFALLLLTPLVLASPLGEKFIDWQIAQEERAAAAAEAAGHPYTGDIPNPTTVVTSAAETRRIALPDSSWVLLKPGSRLTYGRYLSVYNRSENAHHIWYLALEGEAEFHVEPPTKRMSIKTYAASLSLQPGAFVIRAPTAADTAFVTSIIGQASGYGMGALRGYVTTYLDRGASVAIPRIGKPLRLSK
jgi:hypothetical protein